MGVDRRAEGRLGRPIRGDLLGRSAAGGHRRAGLAAAQHHRTVQLPRSEHGQQRARAAALTVGRQGKSYPRGPPSLARQGLGRRQELDSGPRAVDGVQADPRDGIGGQEVI
ncbi:MAG: hypothetical protein ACRC0L_06500, partial [Angustibacter sp.]